jgi:hypothetical protein
VRADFVEKDVGGELSSARAEFTLHREGAAASQRDLGSGYWKRALTRLLILGGRPIRAGWWRRLARVPWGPREIGELVADGGTVKRRVAKECNYL